MKRHVAKHRPKHVRQLVARLAAAGVPRVKVETGRCYRLSWRIGLVDMRIAAATSPSGFDVGAAWLSIRALFRARGLPVPA